MSPRNDPEFEDTLEKVLESLCQDEEPVVKDESPDETTEIKDGIELHYVVGILGRGYSDMVPCTYSGVITVKRTATEAEIYKAIRDKASTGGAIVSYLVRPNSRPYEDTFLFD